MYHEDLKYLYYIVDIIGIEKFQKTGVLHLFLMILFLDFFVDLYYININDFYTFKCIKNEF